MLPAREPMMHASLKFVPSNIPEFEKKSLATWRWVVYIREARERIFLADEKSASVGADRHFYAKKS